MRGLRPSHEQRRVRQARTAIPPPPSRSIPPNLVESFGAGEDDDDTLQGREEITANQQYLEAVKNGELDLVKALLASNQRSRPNARNSIDVNTRDWGGATALHLATQNGNLQMIKLLVEQVSFDASANGMVDSGSGGGSGGVNSGRQLLKIDAKNFNGETPLHWAAQKGMLGIVTLLIDEGKASVNIQESNGSSPLMIAAGNGRLTTVCLLLERGAEIDMQDREGYTAMHRAAKWGREEVVKLLLDEGANPTITTRSGKMACDLAKTPEVRSLLEPFEGEVRRARLVGSMNAMLAKKAPTATPPPTTATATIIAASTSTSTSRTAASSESNITGNSGAGTNNTINDRPSRGKKLLRGLTGMLFSNSSNNNSNNSSNNSSSSSSSQFISEATSRNAGNSTSIDTASSTHVTTTAAAAATNHNNNNNDNTTTSSNSSSSSSSNMSQSAASADNRNRRIPQETTTTTTSSTSRVLVTSNSKFSTHNDNENWKEEEEEEEEEEEKIDEDEEEEDDDDEEDEEEFDLESSVAQLAAMGFSNDLSTDTLLMCNGDLDQALEILLMKQQQQEQVEAKVHTYTQPNEASPVENQGDEANASSCSSGSDSKKSSVLPVTKVPVRIDLDGNTASPALATVTEKEEVAKEESNEANARSCSSSDSKKSSVLPVTKVPVRIDLDGNTASPALATVTEKEEVAKEEEDKDEEDINNKIISRMQHTYLGGAPPNVPFSLLQEWTDNFSPELKIGAGSFGEVYRGTYCIHPTTTTSSSSSSTSSSSDSRGTAETAATASVMGKVAVKRVSPNLEILPAGVTQEERLRDLQNCLHREINVLRSYHHPKIIRLLGYSMAPISTSPLSTSPASASASTSSNSSSGTGTGVGVGAGAGAGARAKDVDMSHFCLVYELAARGGVDRHLTDDTLACQLDWRKRINIASGIASALCYFHAQGVFHRDVKAANVALSADFSPKLIDCGLAKFVPQSAAAAASSDSQQQQQGSTVGAAPAAQQSQSQRFGTPGYMCEQYCRDGVYGHKSEVYSFGVFLAELLSGILQGSQDGYFHDRDSVQDDLTPDSRAGQWPADCVEDLRDLIINCVTGFRRRIPTMLQVLQALHSLDKQHCAPHWQADQATSAYLEQLWEQLDQQQMRQTLATRQARQREQAQHRQCQNCGGACTLGEPGNTSHSPTSGSTGSSGSGSNVRIPIGVECPSQDGTPLATTASHTPPSDRKTHILCRDCFIESAREQLLPENRQEFRRNNCSVICRWCLFESPVALHTKYSELDVASVRDQSLFVSIKQAYKEVVAVQAHETALKEAMELLQRRESAALRVEGRIAGHRRAIEEMLNLRYTGCGLSILLQFDECFGVDCRVCHMEMCAWCLEGFGTDNHAHTRCLKHVKVCPKNPNQGAIYGDLEELNAVHSEVRREKIRTYLKTNVNSNEERSAIIEAVRPCCASVGVSLD